MQTYYYPQVACGGLGSKVIKLTLLASGYENKNYGSKDFGILKSIPVCNKSFVISICIFITQ